MKREKFVLFIHRFSTWLMSQRVFQNFAVFVPEKCHLSQKIYQKVQEWPQKNMACMLSGQWVKVIFDLVTGGMH